MKTFLMLVAVLVCLSPIARAQERPEWRSCSADADCVYIIYPCFATAVSTKFMIAANDYYKVESEKKKDCTLTVEQLKKAMAPKATCMNKQCIIGTPSASATGGEDKQKWFECRSDSECVNAGYPCSGAAVNRKFQAEADVFYKLRAPQVNCTPPTTLPPSRTVCVREKSACKTADGKDDPSSTCLSETGRCQAFKAEPAEMSGAPSK